jgi:signal transduction histidine kinase
MSENLLAPTHDIIHCCEALLSEGDGTLDEKQRKWVENVSRCAGDTWLEDGWPGGLLSAFNWYVEETKSEASVERATYDMSHLVRTPLAIIQTSVYLLLMMGERTGNLSDKQRELINQIQHSLHQIVNEVMRMVEAFRQQTRNEY